MAVKSSPKKHTGSIDTHVKAYEKMFLIRKAEEKIADLYLKKKIMSFVHFYVGQEAVAVGVAESLEKGDKMLGNHRSHGHYLAKGGDLTRMISELLGKENGLAHGKGGSMHMIDKSVNFVGSTPILGSATALACGVAFSQKYKEENDVTVVFIGDGAFEEGIVYETINIAALFKLPLVIVVENNLYSVNSPIKDRRSAGHDAEKIVRGFGAKYMKADGNDFDDVHTKATAAVAHARGGEGPVVLECIAYRHMAHSAPIFDESCRGVDVIDIRKQEDSVVRLRSQLIKKGHSEKKLEQLEKNISRDIDKSIEIAEKSAFPNARELYTHLYE